MMARKLWNIAIVSSIMACGGAVISGANESVQADCLFAFAERIEKGETVKRREVAEAFNKVVEANDEKSLRKLFEDFRKRLCAVKMAGLHVEKKERVVNQVCECFEVLQNNGALIDEEFSWNIRLESLRWLRDAINIAEKERPCDKRTWPQKWGNVRLYSNDEFNRWESFMKRVKRKYSESIRRAGYDIMVCEHSEEFKKRVRDALESIIGRSMNEDDVQFCDGKR